LSSWTEHAAQSGRQLLSSLLGVSANIFITSADAPFRDNDRSSKNFATTTTTIFTIFACALPCEMKFKKEKGKRRRQKMAADSDSYDVHQENAVDMVGGIDRTNALPEVKGTSLREDGRCSTSRERGVCCPTEGRKELK
jgi:hypothetical protein